MKSFIYGIDGGDRRIFAYFEMPFYRNLESEYVHLELHEDLLNRGWSEILTGAEGRDTAGFYMSPDLDGSTRFSMKYKMGDVSHNSDIALLWDRLPKGTKSGVMNVPSLVPVVPVDGFCIGSAGAGISKIKDISRQLAYPDSVRDFLQEQGYIPDIRLNTSGIDDIEELFTRLKEMETIRIRCFMDLAIQHDIDFGFLIDRATTVVQYLFMSEIQAMMDRDSNKAAAFPPTPLVEELLIDFYQFVDGNIKVLYETLRPKRFILTADHGHESMTHHCNPNIVLAENGLYCPAHPIQNEVVRRLKAKIKKWLPRKYRLRLRSSLSVPRSSHVTQKLSGQQFDDNTTLAFSHFYMPGIYLNDTRFGGPVREVDKKKLVEDICDMFNRHPKSIEKGIEAKPYRQLYESSAFNAKLPDVRLELPDSIFVLCRGKSYIEKNDLFGPVPNLDKVGLEMHTGTKGSKPVCLVDPETARSVGEEDVMNLTLVYKLVCRHFGLTI